MSGDREKLLVIKHGAFGDVMQCEGALHDIRLHHPGAHITVLSTPPYAAIMERCPWVDAVLKDPRAPRWRIDKMWALKKDLAAHNFSRVYDLQNSSRTADYFRWFFRDVDWSGTAPGCSLPHSAPDPKSIHSLQRLSGQLQDAGLATPNTLAPNLSWMANNVTDILTDAGVEPGYIVLIPGCSAAHPHKRWPYYQELAARLADAGEKIVTVPGPDEMDLCRTIPGTMLTGDSFLGWFDLAGVLANASFVVGNDTGPSHLAAHMGCHGLALFGHHTTVEKTGIRTSLFDAIEVPNLKDLSVDQVCDRIKQMRQDHSNSV